MTAPKKNDPLSPAEVEAAADCFFELFDVVLSRAPEGTTIEDALKLCESIFAYAHKRRKVADEFGASAPFGFNKKGEAL